MLKLTAPAKNTLVEKWEDEINDMAVGYEIVIDGSADEPEIEHCREKYKGEEAISQYLEELARFVSSWRKCSCEQ